MFFGAPSALHLKPLFDKMKLKKKIFRGLPTFISTNVEEDTPYRQIWPLTGGPNNSYYIKLQKIHRKIVTMNFYFQ